MIPVSDRFTFGDVEQLDTEHLSEILEIVKNGHDHGLVHSPGCSETDVLTDALVDTIGYYTEKQDHLPDIAGRAANTLIQYFADRTYIMQWKKDHEIDTRLRWDTEKSPEEIAVEVTDE